MAEKEKEEKRIKSGVDYSWLMAAKPKIYQIPQLERLQLEELCLKVIKLCKTSITKKINGGNQTNKQNKNKQTNKQTNK